MSLDNDIVGELYGAARQLETVNFIEKRTLLRKAAKTVHILSEHVAVFQPTMGPQAPVRTVNALMVISGNLAVVSDDELVDAFEAAATEIESLRNTLMCCR